MVSNSYLVVTHSLGGAATAVCFSTCTIDPAPSPLQHVVVHAAQIYMSVSSIAETLQQQSTVNALCRQISVDSAIAYIM